MPYDIIEVRNNNSKSNETYKRIAINGDEHIEYAWGEIEANIISNL